MVSATHTTTVRKTTTWAGRIISSMVGLFLTFDCVVKVLELAPAVEATTRLGYPADYVFGIGVLEIVCLAAYAIPRTSVLGAVLLTGYLGGAVASQVRSGADLFTVVFPIMIGALIWAGLLLRDQRLRTHMAPLP